MESNVKDFYTVIEVAKMLQVKEFTVYRFIWQGRLKYIDASGGSMKKPLYRIPRHQLESFLGYKLDDNKIIHKSNEEKELENWGKIKEPEL